MTDPRQLPVPSMWAEPIDGFLDYTKLQGKRAETIRTYGERLRHFARKTPMPVAEVTQAHLLQYFSEQDWARATRRSRTQTLRSFWNWAVRAGLCLANPAVDLPLVQTNAPNPMAVPYRLYLEAVVRADPRTSLILRLAGEHGLRRGEIALINTGRDLLHDDRGWSLVVHGKGGKGRIVPLSDSVSHALRCLPTGPAFPGKINGHLSGRRVSELAKCYLPNPWSIHKLRHMFASRGWAVSRDLLTMQKLLGHASPVTTQMYVEVDDGFLRDVVSSVAVRSFDERTDLILKNDESRRLNLDLDAISSQQATELIVLLSAKIVPTTLIGRSVTAA